MDFSLSSEQAMMKEMAARFFAAHAPSHGETANAAPTPDVWPEMVELGLAGLLVPEPLGGIGGTAADAMIVAEEAGRHLVRSPWLETAIGAAALLGQCRNSPQAGSLLTAIAGGELQLALAWQEAGGRWQPGHCSAVATPVGSGYRIDGTKCGARDCGRASRFLVTARIAGQPASGVFVVPRTAQGLALSPYRTYDDDAAADIALSAVEAGEGDAILFAGDGAFDAVEAALDAMRAALAAEAVGLMEEALNMTVEYLKTRQQFGVPIGSFQVLQHRAADMYVAVEQVRSMAFNAAAALREQDNRRRGALVAAAMVQVCRSARFVGQQSIQLYGGIGMTEEYKVGHLFKRLTMIARQLGDHAFYLERAGATGSLLEPL